MQFTRRRTLLALCTSPLLWACGNSSRKDHSGPEALTRAIVALDPGVAHEEAARAGQVAYAYTDQLAAAYQIEDPPLVHNTKVNAGLKPRGLCWHWAEDMERRLKNEWFRTLSVYRAIAEHPVRITHSTAVISARGEGIANGIVLDPWRYGGVLYWSSVEDDARYQWQARTDILERRMKAAQAAT